jgi:hypothetical protein
MDPSLLRKLTVVSQEISYTLRYLCHINPVHTVCSSYLNSISYPRRSLPSGFFPYGLPTKIQYTKIRPLHCDLQWSILLFSPITCIHLCSVPRKQSTRKQKTKSILMPYYETSGQNQSIKIANGSFGNLVKLKYLLTAVANKNFIHKEFKCRLNSGNSCYHSAQKDLSSRLLSENIKIRMYRTIILLVILDGCEIWPRTLRE